LRFIPFFVGVITVVAVHFCPRHRESRARLPFWGEDEPYFTDEVLPPLADTKANSLRLLFKVVV
ncbi:MAG: hypothetical protein ACRC6S_09195, partial [Shewanella sp.]